MASIVQPPSSSLKKRDTPASREGDQLIITPLGAGNEVGRSCVYMSYKGKTVLVCFYRVFGIEFECVFVLVFLILVVFSFFVVQFDCGIHPAYSGMAALPYFDEIDPSTIDVVLVTQYVLLALLLCYMLCFFSPFRIMWCFWGGGEKEKNFRIGSH